MWTIALLYLSECEWLSLRKEVCIFTDKNSTVIAIHLFRNCLNTILSRKCSLKMTLKSEKIHIINYMVSYISSHSADGPPEASKMHPFLTMCSSVRYFLLSKTEDAYLDIQRWMIKPQNNSKNKETLTTTCDRYHHVSDPLSHSTVWSGIWNQLPGG